MSADKQIEEILGKYGEPIAGNIWRVQGHAVIYHKTLERIAAQADVRFARPQIIRAEGDEAVILVEGQLGDHVEWSIGEAKINVNYRVAGRQAAYVYAMAEKRGKDRVILKLIGLHGLLYSEDEADDFKPEAVTARPRSVELAIAADPRGTVMDSHPIPQNGGRISSAQAKRDGSWEKYVTEINECGSLEDLDEWRAVRDEELRRLPYAWKEEIKEVFITKRRELTEAASPAAYLAARGG